LNREERRISRRGAVPWNPDILLSQSTALEIKYSDLMESEDGANNISSSFAYS